MALPVKRVRGRIVIERLNGYCIKILTVVVGFASDVELPCFLVDLVR
jgi:hypothetical protein